MGDMCPDCGSVCRWSGSMCWCGECGYRVDVRLLGVTEKPDESVGASVLIPEVISHDITVSISFLSHGQRWPDTYVVLVGACVVDRGMVNRSTRRTLIDVLCSIGINTGRAVWYVDGQMLRWKMQKEGMKDGMKDGMNG